jgi:DNA-binding Xre family transcriptional regulator
VRYYQVDYIYAVKYSLGVIRIRLDKFVQPVTDLSLLKVAEKSGITYTPLHDLKTGKTTVMKTDSLDKIITALRELTGEEITPNDLLEYVPTAPKKTKK